MRIVGMSQGQQTFYDDRTRSTLLARNSWATSDLIIHTVKASHIQTFYRQDFDFQHSSFEPPHDKTNKMTVRPVKTQISLGIHPV